jgi:hypothetical protein
MTGTLDWVAANQRHLTAHVRRIRRLLADHAGVDASLSSEPDLDGAVAADASFAVDRACETFHLSPFERDTLLLCAGCELDARVAAIVASLGSGDPRPTFGLALAALADAHWRALTPAAPLRVWRLLELDGASLTRAPLRIDERVLHWLAGIDEPDERIRAVVERLEVGSVDGVDESTVAAVADHCLTAHVVQVTGGDMARARGIAAAACEVLGAHGLCLHVDDIPAVATERVSLARALARESLMSKAVTVITGAAVADETRVARFLDALRAPAIVLAPEPMAFDGRAASVEMPRRNAAAREAAWRAVLGPDAARLNGGLEAVSAQFDLDATAIRRVAARAALRDDGSPAAATAAVWEACRVVTRPRLDGLAQRIETVAGWNDLVMPEAQARVLRDIARQVRHRATVYDAWGFAAKSGRGLGVTALFAGASGTGKTMAAEVLAGELRLDLYRIDLAAVVSKYIGETEKNLKRLFDAAEGSGAILLFDEADALFGKRSDVRDSHDRYANIEVSYLLQRMEAYRGLAILTTNMKQALDPAFARRIRFVVTFPFPDAVHRARIWRGIFPDRTPQEPLDYDRLAQLNVSGGHIRNIALAAAFIAAEHQKPVSMRHLADAVRAEYAKLERPLSDGELRGWA